ATHVVQPESFVGNRLYTHSVQPDHERVEFPDAHRVYGASSIHGPRRLTGAVSAQPDSDADEHADDCERTSESCRNCGYGQCSSRESDVDIPNRLDGATVDRESNAGCNRGQSELHSGGIA